MIKKINGNLFKHIPKSGRAVFAHATSIKGQWGQGVAKEFAENYPLAYFKHQDFVKSTPAVKLIGTSQVIESEKNDPGNAEQSKPAVIAVLYALDVEDQYGADQVTAYADLALTDMEGKLPEDVESDEGKPVINIPKISAGALKVPWSLNEKALFRHDKLKFNVYSLEKGWPEHENDEDPNSLNRLPVG